MGAFDAMPCHVETYSKNNVMVFRDNFESLQFARQIATLKDVQTDSRPFYVMDMGRVGELLDVWREFLPRVRPFYAVNCNADNVLLKILAGRQDVGFHCQTRENVDKALEHVAPERILYSNACWTRSTAANAVKRELRRLSFESARDLTRLLASLNSNEKQNTDSSLVELILNVCVNNRDCYECSDDDGYCGDVEASFGCALDEAVELLQLAVDMGVPCAGVAFNLGSSGAKSGASLSARYESAIAEMARLFSFAEEIGSPLHVLNIGGDFSGQNVALKSVEFAKVCAQINESLSHHFPTYRYGDMEVIATPGRFVAESAFTLITNVVGRQPVDASHVTNDDFDTGTEAFIYETNEGYYGSFGCQIYPNCNSRCEPLFNQYSLTDEECVYSNVMGPTRDERFDLLDTRCRFRPLCVGEWLIWANMGAYTLNNCEEYSVADTSSGEEEVMENTVTAAPAVFYFTSQHQWNHLNSECASEMASTQVDDAQFSESGAETFMLSAFGDDEEFEDEGIRSASPSSMISAEDASFKHEDFLLRQLDDDLF